MQIAPELQTQPGMPPSVIVREAERAREALGKELWAEAFGLSVKIMAQRVPDVDTLGTLALSAAVLGEQKMHEAALNRLLQVENEPRYYHPLALGVADLAANRAELAGRRFDKILSHIPNDPLARYFRGRVLELGKKPAEALRDYRRPCKAVPISPLPWRRWHSCGPRPARPGRRSASWSAPPPSTRPTWVTGGPSRRSMSGPARATRRARCTAIC